MGQIQHNNVWVVFGESTDMQFALELITVTFELANLLNSRPEAVFVGGGLEPEMVLSFSKAGCATVRHIVDGTKGPEQEYSVSRTLADLSKKLEPQIILFPSNLWGRSVASQVAALLQTGLTADCTTLAVDESLCLVQTRPAYGGSVFADILCRERRPQLTTIRKGVFSAELLLPPRYIPVIPVQTIRLGSKSTDTLESPILSMISNNLSNARVILAGGAAIGSKESFQKLLELGEYTGAAVGASRAAVNAGFAPYSMQIGQTGRTVAPELYVAFGISGTVQHVAGIHKAKIVIAVNHDPKALLFHVADYIVIADCNVVIEQLLEKAKGSVGYQ